jgi:hypothetical protein
MYGIGKCDVGFGMSISEAANIAPGGGFGGMMETFAMSSELPFGNVGRRCKVRVEASSCRVYNKSSGMIPVRTKL